MFNINSSFHSPHIPIDFATKLSRYSSSSFESQDPDLAVTSTVRPVEGLPIYYRPG